MAGFNGRQLTIDWDSVTLVGVRTKGYTITNDYVDVTTDDDSGWRTLLADPGLRSIEVTVGGISSDEALIADIMAASVAAETLDVDLPSALSSPGSLSGSFLVSSFEQSGEHDGAVEFSATFMSTGAVTYTASSGT
jgi:TP901-1 family phage major tail protein